MDLPTRLTPARLIMAISLAVLAALVAFTGYYALNPARLSDIERERFSKLDDRWVLDFDIVNRDQVEHAYVIRVDTGDPAMEPLRVAVPPGQRFMSTTNIFPHNLKKKEVVLEIYRDSEPEPIQTSRFYLD